MTDDLVKRLRETTHMYQVDCELKMKCADRIEELEAENRRLKAEIESYNAMKAVRDKLNTPSSSLSRIEELQTQIEELHYAVTAAHLKGYMDGKQAAEAKLNDQTHLIEQLFALLDIEEQKDDGRYFHPNILRSSRALDAEKLEEILGKLRGYIND